MELQKELGVSTANSELVGKYQKKNKYNKHSKWGGGGGVDSNLRVASSSCHGSSLIGNPSDGRPVAS